MNIDYNSFSQANKWIILREENLYIKEVFFLNFDRKTKLIKLLPDIVNLLNIYKDKSDVLKSSQ